MNSVYIQISSLISIILTIIMNTDGITPLSVLESIIEENSTFLKSADDYGRTPLHIAALQDDTDAAAFLLKHGISANVTDLYGNSPLMNCSCQNAARTAALLIENGAGVNAQSKARNSPISNACSGGHAEVLKVLIKSGADANLAMDDGNLPIHVACEKKRTTTIEILKILIAAGADPNAVNEDGQSPADITRDPAVKRFLSTAATANVPGSVVNASDPISAASLGLSTAPSKFPPREPALVDENITETPPIKTTKTHEIILYFDKKSFSPRFGRGFFSVEIPSFSKSSDQASSRCFCSSDSSIVLYDIFVRRGPNQWIVRKRYTQFLQLNTDIYEWVESLVELGPIRRLMLPPKTVLSIVGNNSLLLERMVGLFDYLEALLKIVSEKRLVVDSPLYEFLELNSH